MDGKENGNLVVGAGADGFVERARDGHPVASGEPCNLARDQILGVDFWIQRVGELLQVAGLDVVEEKVTGHGVEPVAGRLVGNVDFGVAVLIGADHSVGPETTEIRVRNIPVGGEDLLVRSVDEAVSLQGGKLTVDVRGVVECRAVHAHVLCREVGLALVP